ncbi:hypothetical protein Syun_008539 [Stephania yunnanensis]|uniref:Uncharacterized protein n=1 Tax=Stephania yunnanensis TaxID=152371 RepID=A0AAP0KE06_9MAGN
MAGSVLEHTTVLVDEMMSLGSNLMDVNVALIKYYIEHNLYHFEAWGEQNVNQERYSTIGRGGRGGKARKGSTLASRVEVVPPELKRLTSTNRKKKVD